MKYVWLLLLMMGVGMAFEVPTEAVREKAVGDLGRYDGAMKRVFRNGGEFEAKKAPGGSDWLAGHKEPGQTYAQWALSEPNMPKGKRMTLYILPLGGFENGKAPKVEKLREYAAAYFYPLEVKLLPAVPDKEVVAGSRVNRFSQNKQWNSRDLLAWLPDKLPADGYAMLAVTMTDLYPDADWNFVFGQASIKKRVGVFSFARYHPSWVGRAPGEGTEALVLRRAAKVLTHEMGHMFGIRHCIYYECNMNGANHLAEADSTPMHLCPVCLRKLQAATKFDPLVRYGKLEVFYEANGLEEEQEWVEERSLLIRGAKE